MKITDIITFKEKVIYLVVRGTDSKSGWIAKEYNQIDKNATHIAIGFLINEKLKLFHISDELSIRNDNLFFESLDDFILRDDLKYLSIWELKEIDNDHFNNIIKSLMNSLRERQYFDKQIEFNNDVYYCSEYINDILSKNNINIFDDNIILLKGIPKIFLGRDTLNYYPVDGFMQSNKVIKIFEWNSDIESSILRFFHRAKKK
ncbi:MAG TPA: hypothetical protein VL022_09080 [Moheibacter sp.]|nr:hypothetical protein [Moheibacter sp.]